MEMVLCQKTPDKSLTTGDMHLPFLQRPPKFLQQQVPEQLRGQHCALDHPSTIPRWVCVGVVSRGLQLIVAPVSMLVFCPASVRRNAPGHTGKPAAKSPVLTSESVFLLP
eukprot:1159426-Pelagomonas_calceolata.AAC.4